MTELVCEPLGTGHDRTRFDCGDFELNEWIRKRARQDQARHAAAVFVFVPESEPTRIAGFYSLSATSLSLTALPDRFAKKLPRYPFVPAVLIGRLARSLDFPGVGKKLLFSALKRALRSSGEIASAVVLVDAKNEHAREFYLSFGFDSIAGSPNRLFIPMTTVEQLYAP